MSSHASTAAHEELEAALERLFRLGGNKRFDTAQAEAVGAAVTRSGYAVLRCLSLTPGMTIAALARSVAMDAATASRQVDRLVGDAMIERRTAPSDARAVLLDLTSHGRAVYEAIADHRRAYLSDQLASWTESDLGNLAAAVNRLATDLSSTPDS